METIITYDLACITDIGICQFKEHSAETGALAIQATKKDRANQPDVDLSRAERSFGPVLHAEVLGDCAIHGDRSFFE